MVDDNTVKIGSKKELSKYITACLVSFDKYDTIKILARGNNVKTAIDVLAILKRVYIDNPEYDIQVDSEHFGERNVSTIEITLKGTKKSKEEK